jgi:hypothetical protein
MTYNRNATDYLEEHLPYEVSMTRVTFNWLQENAPLERTVERQLLINVLLAAFALHARNLLDFQASDFAGPPFDSFRRFPSFVGRLYGQMHVQILHLGDKRSRNAEEKINNVALVPLMQYLDAEFAAFLSAMHPDAKRHFDKAPAPPLS